MARKSQTIEAIQAARIKAEELLRQLQEREREALAAVKQLPADVAVAEGIRQSLKALSKS